MKTDPSGQKALEFLNKMDLIDLYYPTDEIIAALLLLSPEQRAALVHRLLPGTSEAETDRHTSRILAIIDEFASTNRS
jgi:hypothetical protein